MFLYLLCYAKRPQSYKKKLTYARKKNIFFNNYVLFPKKSEGVGFIDHIWSIRSREGERGREGGRKSAREGGDTAKKKKKKRTKRKIKKTIQSPSPYRQ